MKQTILFFLILFISFFQSNAQQWDWARNDFHKANFYNSAHIAYAAGNIYATFDDSIAKYSDSGLLIWTIRINHTIIYDIDADKVGNFYITGSYTDTADFGIQTFICIGDENIFVAKYSANGICQWVKSYGGTSRNVGRSLSLGVNDDIYLTGFIHDTITIGSTILYASVSSAAFIIARYDGYGNNYWAKQSFGWAAGEKIKTDSAGNAYVLGTVTDSAYFDSQLLVGTTPYGTTNFLVKYNILGNCIWAKYAGYFVYNRMNRMADDKSQDIYITWDDRYNYSYLYKFDKDGNQIWRKRIAHASYESAVGGLIYTTEHYVYTSISYTYIGNYCSNTYQEGMMVLKLDSSGNCIWAKYANAYGYPSDIINGSFNDLYSIGTFGLTGQFGTTIFSTNNYYNIYVARISDTFTNVTSEDDFTNFIHLFPNPTTGLFTLHCPLSISNSQLNIYNSLGELVHQQFITSSTQQVDLNVKPGVYLVEAAGTRQKLVVY
jgi:hypothetical protein